VEVVAGSSALIIDIIACTFVASPSSDTVTRLGCMDEVTQAPSGPATWFMPGAGVDANSGSFITSETSGVKLRHRKAMTVKNLAASIAGLRKRGTSPRRGNGLHISERKY
jgi:hypothetical protein